MSCETGNNFQYWIDKLLQFDSNTYMSYTEALCAIADLQTSCNVAKEELNRLQIKVENRKAECKYKLEFRDTLCQLYEELNYSNKRVEELIKVKNYNAELAQEIHDLKKQKALEKEKQDKKTEKQLNDVYKESMKIFESNPLVINRNQLRNQVAKGNFEISLLKQKISDAEKVYANLKNIEKLVKQREIIRFAGIMVKYYKEQKERNEILIKKQNLNNSNNLQEQKNNLQMVIEELNENFIAEPLKKLEPSSYINPTNYDYIYKKTLSQYEGSMKNITSMRNIETPKLNMTQIQVPTYMSNYQFNPKNYFNTTSSVNSKSEQKTYIETPIPTMSNILKTPKSNLKLSNLPKYNFENMSSQTKKEKNSISQTKKKQELKRPFETQKIIIKPKISAITKSNLDIKRALNTSAENEERMFLSQPESKNASQIEDTFVSLSQGSKKSAVSNSSQMCNLQKETPKKIAKMDNTSISQSSQHNRQSLIPNQMFNLHPSIEKSETITAKNISLNQSQNQRQSGNQMFHLGLTVPKMIKTKETQNLSEYNKQTSTRGQMFNLPTMTPKMTETSEVLHQNPTEYNRQGSLRNQIFNMQATVPKMIEANETQKQNPPEYSQQTLSMNQMFNLPTMSPKKTVSNKPQQNPTEYSRQTPSMNQMFNLQATVAKNETQQQNLIEQNKQTYSMNQMFNLPTMSPKKTVSNKPQQNSIEYSRQTPSMNQMFNLQSMTPKKIGINETQKQNPVENISKPVNFTNPVISSRPAETKSPYFMNNTITSQEESVSLNTSAEQSDQVVNVPSDQPPSQTSAVNTSGEYFDANINQPMDIEQMINAEDVPMMDFANRGYNTMQYYGENLDNVTKMMPDLESNQYISPPFTSPPNYVSPPNDETSGENQQNNIPTSTANNIFSPVQNSGNSFFSFGQPQSKRDSIFNMF